ncbi:MAG: hypothetical protein KF838_11480 [Phycisphaeraceae bacterium]|nr:MAG: hypothetical protein KF838_11480 [Phycisphaeraceae bacterium]
MRTKACFLGILSALAGFPAHSQDNSDRVTVCFYKGVGGNLDVTRSLIWHLYNGTTVVSASGNAFAANLEYEFGTGFCYDEPSVTFNSDSDSGSLGSVYASVPNASVSITQTTHVTRTKGSFDSSTAVHHWPPAHVICEPGGSGIRGAAGYSNSYSIREFSGPDWALIKHIGPASIGIFWYNGYPEACLLLTTPTITGVWFGADELYEIDTNDDEFPFVASHDMMVFWSDGTVDRYGDVEDPAFDPVGDDPIVIEIEDEEFTIVESDSQNATRVRHNSYQEIFSVIGNVDQDPDSTICWADRVALLSLPQVAIGQFGYRARGDIDLDGDIDVDDYYAFNALPCNADLNCDGIVDITDYLDYFDYYGNEDPIADMNGDNEIDIVDMLDFLDAYAVGC